MNNYVDKVIAGSNGGRYCIAAKLLIGLVREPPRLSLSYRYVDRNRLEGQVAERWYALLLSGPRLAPGENLVMEVCE